MRLAFGLAALASISCGSPRPPVVPAASVDVFTRPPATGCYDIMPTIVVGEPSSDLGDPSGAVYAPQDYDLLAARLRARLEACSAERVGAVGAITFRLVIQPNGEIDRVEAASSLPPPLTACATRALQAVQIDPPSCGNHTTLVVLFRSPK